MASGIRSRIGKAALAGAVAGVCLFASAAKAEIIRVSDMMRGVEINPAQCSAIGDAVWVNVHNQGFCIRYFLSTEGGASGKPIVFLQGDQFGALDPRSRNFYPSPEIRDTDTTKLMGLATALSRAARTPAIYLARIGVDGSSGHHRVRRTVLELHAMNAALDRSGRSTVSKVSTSSVSPAAPGSSAACWRCGATSPVHAGAGRRRGQT